MVKTIIHDELFLQKRSIPATPLDVNVGDDLLDTLRANARICVGLAANMIGVGKCVIAFNNDGKLEVMYNPVITKKSGEFEAEEGCLSLKGTRKTLRYKRIKVQYEDRNFKKHSGEYYDWTAQIIQHEIDHCNGILI